MLSHQQRDQRDPSGTLSKIVMCQKDNLVILLKRILAIISPLFIYGCTFLPSVSEQQSYASECEMVTRELTLASEFFDLHGGCGTDAKAPACYLAVAIGVPAVSFVVSGSIVLAGNTIHWLEYQGRCEDSYLSKSI